MVAGSEITSMEGYVFQGITLRGEAKDTINNPRESRVPTWLNIQ